MSLSKFEKISLVAGLIIRLILMPITLHSDLWANTIAGYFWASKGVFNIYDYLANLPLTHPLVNGFGVNDLFIYSPLAYFTFGIMMKIFQPFLNSGLIELAMSNPGAASQSASIFLHSFLIKFPYLIFDLGIAFLLRSFFTSPWHKRLVFLLWLFNPVSIYVTFMMGQTSDIPQTFLVVLALILAFKGRNSLSLGSLGLAAGYKMFPLFFIPIAAFILEKNMGGRIKLLVVGLGVYFLTILPFLATPAFRSAVLSSSASQKLLFMKLPLTGAEGIYVFIFLYALILLASWFGFFARKALWLPLLLVALTFLSVSHYHPQWFLWVTPFLALLLVSQPAAVYKQLVVMLFCIYVLLVFFFESSLTWGLFGPVNHALFSAPSLTEILPKAVDVNMIKSLLRSLFAAVALYLSVKLLREKSYEI